MSSLYRRYRPKKFSQILGQDHIVRVLLRSIIGGQIGHAYLFCGSRGTGKTTIARLFAKAINCHQPDEGEPCGRCQICQIFDNDQFIDVLEIDAASHRGIDDIRDLRDKVRYPPTLGRFRVYIIDEVHMLTPDAFNALLKTLEEPPSHIVFILATTEYHKLPETIISRCERYHFYRASEDKIAELIGAVAKEEKIKLSDEAAYLLARRAEGSYRDALTFLGSLSLTESEITADRIRLLLGLPSAELVERIYQSIINSDPVQIIGIVEEHRAFGGDLSVLVGELTGQIEEMILSQPMSEMTPIRSHILEELLIGIVRIKSINEPTGLLLAILIRLAGEQEKKTALPVEEATGQPQVSTQVVDVQKIVKPSPDDNPVDTLRQTTQPDHPTNFWNEFLREVKSHNHALYMVIRSASLGGTDDNKLVIIVRYKFYADRLNEAKNKKIVENSAAKLLGYPITLECQVRSDLEIAIPPDETFEAVVEVFELER